MNKRLEPVPEFTDEAAEREFWERHDSADYLDWTKAEQVRMPRLKPTGTEISPNSGGAA